MVNDGDGDGFWYVVVRRLQRYSYGDKRVGRYELLVGESARDVPVCTDDEGIVSEVFPVSKGKTGDELWPRGPWNSAKGVKEGVSFVGSAERPS